MHLFLRQDVFRPFSFILSSTVPRCKTFRHMPIYLCFRCQNVLQTSKASNRFLSTFVNLIYNAQSVKQLWTQFIQLLPEKRQNYCQHVDLSSTFAVMLLPEAYSRGVREWLIVPIPSRSPGIIPILIHTHFHLTSLLFPFPPTTHSHSLPFTFPLPAIFRILESLEITV